MNVGPGPTKCYELVLAFWEGTTAYVKGLKHFVPHVSVEFSSGVP